jgi:hypothetical protein
MKVNTEFFILILSIMILGVKEKTLPKPLQRSASYVKINPKYIASLRKSGRNPLFCIIKVYQVEYKNV